uniref:Protein kinase domain-containing protein n=1 Tax=Laticauda laticaudata TaxID=8630 RepID=A0A8C5RC98_LATLA
MDKHGCPAYVGPEILSCKGSYSGKAADIWSLGVALYTLLVGCYPFQGTKPILLFGKICRGRFTVPSDLSPKAQCLIRCLLRRDPAERLTASGILLHPWTPPKEICVQILFFSTSQGWISWFTISGG